MKLSEVPRLRWLAKRHGKRLHVATVFRWASRGLDGHRLRTVMQGGSMVTTERWVWDFFNRPRVGYQAPTTRQRERAVERATRELEEAGI